MKRIDAKEVGLITLTGVGVVILTPIVAGLIASIPMMSVTIIPDILTVGQTIAAGVSAWVTSTVIEKFLR